MIFGQRGGMRPDNRKERTRRKPLAELEVLPGEITLFLQQSTEAAARPIVTVNQWVQEGECVASVMGDGVPVFASLSGQVTAIETRPDACGRLRSAIVIRPDNRENMTAPRRLDWETILPDEMIRQTQAFGLVEQVGDPIPLHVKILDSRGRVNTLIINGTECQPYLTASYRLGLEHSRELLVGARLLARILGVTTTIFAITGDQLTSIERLERDLRRGIKASDVGREVKVKTLATRYPLYHDKQIIKAVTGREIPPEKTAVAVGCQVFSLASVCALGHAFLTGIPVTRTAVTVSGYAVSRPRNLWVPLGTSLHTLLECCNGVEEEPALTLLGGLLTGDRVVKLRGPVEQNTQALLCLLRAELPIMRKQQTCLQCGSCVGVCPMGLCPVFVARALTKRQMEKLDSLHPQDCIGCGACASVCPSHLPLVSIMRSGVEYIQGREVEA